MKYYYSIFASLLVAAIVLVSLTSSPSAADATKVGVMFSHEIHKELAACADCHAAAESQSAEDNLIPGPSACQSCHEEADVRKYWGLDATTDLAEVKGTPRPHELRFSHKFHAGAQKMECAYCHIPVGDSFTGPSMDGCYECHNNAEKIAPIVSMADAMQQNVATNQCEACHTNLANLLPKNHRMADFSRFHGKMALTGEDSRDCAVCHSQSFCAECHTPTNDVPAPSTKTDFYIGSYPRGEKMDDGGMLTSQQAHSLTYKYTHGFDARIQSSRCATCHEQESFCVDCHTNGYDANGERIVPQSHQLAGFASATGGKAMNRHARLASMDIQHCATCHNVDGGDPVCMVCHSTGVAGGENK